MPNMDWDAFQRDHHRPYLVVVEAKDRATALLGKADLERLAVTLGVSGNYAIKRQGASIYTAFEINVDAIRFAAVLRPITTTREWEWASKALARMDGATIRRISAMLGKDERKTPGIRRRRRPHDA